MDRYRFEDALTGSTLSCGYPGLDASLVRGGVSGDVCASVFFPGCSLLNYALPLVRSVCDLLKDAGEADGASLLCCGKILSYERDGANARAAFEGRLAQRVHERGVKRVVAACPNCAKALRDALARDGRTAQVTVEPLPAVLAHLGYRIDPDAACAMVAAEQGEGACSAHVKLCPHDSCPDRDTGEFADGLRALLPAELVAEAANSRKHSLCCGSLVRAMGKREAADKQARGRAAQAQEAGAAALVTACASCSYQLTAAQKDVLVFHYLELLYNWRIPWPHLDGYMKLRFLFDEWPSAAESAGARSFVGLDS